MQSRSQDSDLPQPKCKDCKMCQSCSESRCLACRSGKLHRRLSIQEQIALFNSLNPNLLHSACCQCAQDNEK